MEETNNQINLRTLKRTDPLVSDIAVSAGQVAVYKFSAEENEWVRKEVEGSMFVVQRSAAPFYELIVINRLNTENMVLKISDTVDTSLEPPYLMVRNDTGEIFCIWFYQPEDSVRVYEKLKQVQELASRKMPPQHLSSAQKTSTPVGKDHDQTNSQIFKRLLSVDRTVDETVEKNQSTSPTKISTKSNIRLTKQVPMDKRVTASEPQVVQSQQTPNSNQKYSINLQSLFPNFQASNASQDTPSEKKQPNAEISFGTNGSKNGEDFPVDGSAKKTFKEVSDRPRSESQRPTQPPSNPMPSPMLNPLGNPVPSAVPNWDCPPPTVPTLIHAPAPSQIPSSLISPPYPQFPVATTPIVQTDMSNAAPNRPLTMEQLKQTLVYLLQNDADFLHAIHTAYINSIRK